MKTCTKCQTPKPLDEFVKDKRRSDGRGSWCVLCNRGYMRDLVQTPKVRASRQAHYQAHKEPILVAAKVRWAMNKEVYQPARDKWAAENRSAMLGYYKDKGAEHRAFIDALKEGHPCLDCGDSFPPYVMEYDHVRGEKRFNLGKMANHRREAVLEELAKCELICCACHRVRTQARNTHGEHTGPSAKYSQRRLLEFREWLSSLKAHPCLDCGKRRPPEAMDYDHVSDNKIHGISSMWSWGRARVLAEVAKCELVCANCHRIRTQTRPAAVNPPVPEAMVTTHVL